MIAREDEGPGRLWLTGFDAPCCHTMVVDKPMARHNHFAEDLRRMEMKSLAVELLERLLQGKIKARMRTILVQEEKYSDGLIEALLTCHKEGRYPVAQAMRIP